jgi:hypothetical protein
MPDWYHCVWYVEIIHDNVHIMWEWDLGSYGSLSLLYVWVRKIGKPFYAGLYNVLITHSRKTCPIMYFIIKEVIHKKTAAIGWDIAFVFSEIESIFSYELSLMFYFYLVMGVWLKIHTCIYYIYHWPIPILGSCSRSSHLTHIYCSSVFTNPNFLWLLPRFYINWHVRGRVGARWILKSGNSATLSWCC